MKPDSDRGGFEAGETAPGLLLVTGCDGPVSLQDVAVVMSVINDATSRPRPLIEQGLLNL